MQSISTDKIQPSRVIHDLKGRPVMVMDIYSNFFWMDKLPNGQYRFTNIPHLIKVPDVAQPIQEETTTN